MNPDGLLKPFSKANPRTSYEDPVGE